MAKAALSLMTALVLTRCLTSRAAEPEQPAVPDTYTLDYPAADRWCPPIRSAFVDAAQSMSQVRGRRFRHQPNGGYGLPIQQKVGNQHLLHLGADLGWFQLGEPVFAVAAGIVRRSEGPTRDDKEATAKKRPQSMMWGNIVVIEHRVEASGQTQYLTTIYGHLDTDRLVEIGDIVEAGQQIGKIGANHIQINGGYNPHLHFGIRQGRFAEIGAVLMQARVDGESATLRIKSLDAEKVLLESSREATKDLGLRLAGETFTLQVQDNGYVASSRILWYGSFPEFPIVGYDLTATGWHDPIQTLRTFRADTNPAPFRLAARKQ